MMGTQLTDRISEFIEQTSVGMDSDEVEAIGERLFRS